MGDSKSGMGCFVALLVREWPGRFRGAFPAGLFRGLGTSAATSIWKGGDNSGGMFALGTSLRSPLRGVDVELPALERDPFTIIVDLGEDVSLSLSLSLGTTNRPFAVPEGVAAFTSLVSLDSFEVGLSLGGSRLRSMLGLGSRVDSSLGIPSPVLGFFCGWRFSSGSGGRFRFSCICESVALSFDCASGLNKVTLASLFPTRCKLE